MVVLLQIAEAREAQKADRERRAAERKAANAAAMAKKDAEQKLAKEAKKDATVRHSHAHTPRRHFLHAAAVWWPLA